MADVTLSGISKRYGPVTAVRAFDLHVADGEFLVLLGPSGCGKSTTLRMIAGLESNTTGEIRIGGARVDDVDPKDRGVAMVFQNYALYPHKTVAENMGMALKLQRVPRAEIDARVGDVARMLGLDALLDRKPGQLSGGQRQRVAIGRAIVRTPQVFLFDEPLSNLDAKLRVRTRLELQELHDRLGVTSIYVTHDQVEAMTLADRIVVMSDGEVAQVGTPAEVYDHPATEFVAGFIGNPAMNFLALARDAQGWRVDGTDLTLPNLPGLDPGGARRVTLGLRPEHVEVVPEADGPWTHPAEVVLSELLGADALLDLSVRGARLLARVRGTDHVPKGTRLALHLPPDRLHAFDAESGAALPRRASEDRP